MRLKNRLIRGGHHDRSVGFMPGHRHEQKKIDINDICHRFNRGKCSFSPTCKYEHHCSFSLKWGHAVINCHKAMAERNHKVNNGGAAGRDLSPMQACTTTAQTKPKH